MGGFYNAPITAQKAFLGVLRVYRVLYGFTIKGAKKGFKTLYGIQAAPAMK